MNVLDDLEYRGLVKDVSDKDHLRKLLETPQTIYVGFDPSASSLHLGNFLMISLLMRLQKAGHRVIVLVGGATGMIGDPSGKSSERNLLDKETLNANIESIRSQLSHFIDLSDPKKGILVNNYDWLSKINLIDFLRDYGKHFSINYLLAKDIIASRLESGISFTEFSYNILQAIDFLHLYETEDCHIQMGGSDQWGNLTSGLELIRKVKGSDAEVEVMTAPLITRSDGTKFGKSESGALFLDPILTSPYKLYQFLINTGDDEAINYLKVFTFLTKEEIEAIEKEHLAHLGERIGQKALAKEVTTIIHGKEKTDEAIKMSEVLFSGDIKSLSEEELVEVFSDYIVDVDHEMILEDLLLTVGAASSKREAREFCANSSISVNGEKETDSKKVITKNDALFHKFTLLKRGKKNYYLVKHDY
ncbi:MAG: tyrosine--tRNA ligase [Coprobacillus sp.]|nr:tyrosine--tRNA ligase [Coprobacillus sp.]